MHQARPLPIGSELTTLALPSITLTILPRLVVNESRPNLSHSPQAQKYDHEFGPVLLSDCKSI